MYRYLRLAGLPAIMLVQFAAALLCRGWSGHGLRLPAPDEWLVCGTAALLATLLLAALLHGFERRLTRRNATLEETVQRRGRALLETRNAVIFGLAKLAESRDDDTGEHVERVRKYVEILASTMAHDHPELDPSEIALLGLTSSLHDIGKVGLPDAVLLKPGGLTPEERRIVQDHPILGGDCLMAIKERLADDHFLDVACEIAYAHHERWDGSGYPFGLRGQEIPLSARIVALADVYDALTTRRVYKAAIRHEQAVEIILEGAGKHFDPAVVRAFLRSIDQFRRISEPHAEPLRPAEPERVLVPVAI